MTRALPDVAERLDGAEGAEGNPVLTLCSPVFGLNTLLLEKCLATT